MPTLSPMPHRSTYRAFAYVFQPSLAGSDAGRVLVQHYIQANAWRRHNRFLFPRSAAQSPVIPALPPVRSRADCHLFRDALYWWLSIRPHAAAGYADVVLSLCFEDLGGLGGVW